MKTIVEQLTALADMHQRLTGGPVESVCMEKLEHYAGGKFNIVVLGEIKKGKSSFVNALLGIQDLLPVDTDIATSCAFRVSYGEQLSYTVHFQPELAEDGTLQPARESMVLAGADEAVKFGTENGNPLNREKVDYIDVTCPSEFLKAGFTLIDTPGLGGLYEGHRAMTYRYVTQADAVFFVVDHTAPLGKLECQYIDDVLAVTPYLYFVQTKCSTISESACDKRKENNLSIIQQAQPAFSTDNCYFMVDSHDAFSSNPDVVECSGYPELHQFCRETLQPERKKLIVERLAQMWGGALARCRNALMAHDKVINSDKSSELQQMKEAVLAAQTRFAEWKGNLQKTYHAPVASRLRHCFAEALSDCSNMGVGGAISFEYSDLIKACKDMDELKALVKGNEMAPSLRDRFLMTLKAEYERIVKVYIQSVTREIAALMNAAAADLTGLSVAELNMIRIENVLSPVENNNYDASAYEYIRAMSLGAGACGKSGTIVGGIAGTIIPGVGTGVGATVGGLVGSLWGAVQGLGSMKSTGLNQAKTQITNVVNQALGIAAGQINQLLQNLQFDISQLITQKMTAFITAEEERMKKELRTLSERSQLSVQQLNDARKQQSQDKLLFNAALKCLSI